MTHLESAPAAVPTTFQGIDTIDHFGDPSAEYAALRASAGVARTSWRAAIELTGNERVAWLQGLFTNDLKKLTAGQGCYGVHLTVKGKSVADMHVLARPDSLVLITTEARRKPLVETLDRYLIREEVAILDHVGTWDEINVQGPAAPEDVWTSLAVHGPTARAAVEAAFGTVPELAIDAFVERDGVLCVRADWTGGPGYDFHGPAPKLDALQAELAKYARPVGFAALNTARIEAGTPWYGEDMDENTIPIEAGLEARAISYTKGCYVGQEVIARIHSQGHVNRNLVGLTLEGDVLPVKGAKLKTPERELGWVTSAVHSPALGGGIAMGYVRRDHAKPGTALDTDGAPSVRATVHALPFRTFEK